LKLSGTTRWLEAKKLIEAEHGIAVNFSDHDGYYTAYRYISKSDDMVFHSTRHPNLDEICSPRTKGCQQIKHTEKGAVRKSQMWLIRKLLPRPREGKNFQRQLTVNIHCLAKENG
jgi:hypothetical protein